MRRAEAIGSHIALSGLALLVLGVPLAYCEGVYEYALLPKRLLLQVCVAISVLGWFIRSISAQRSGIVSSTLTRLAVCFLAVQLASVPLSTNRFDAVAELSYGVGLFALFVVAANVLQLGNLRYLLWVNTVAGLAVSTIGILQYHGIAFLDLPTNGHPGATFGYRNFAAMYLICALPLSCLLFLLTRPPTLAVVPLLSTTAMAVFLAYTRTRGAWVGIALALLLTSALAAIVPQYRSCAQTALRACFSGKKRAMLGGGFLIALVLAPMPARFVDTGLQRFDEKKSGLVSTAMSIAAVESDRGRLAMWRNTLDLIVDNPLLGVGPGGWKYEYPPYDRGAMIRPNSSPKRPHNDYLWVASEHGVLGLGLYVTLLAAGLSGLLSMARRREPEAFLTATLLAISLGATLGHSVFSFPREQPQGAMFLPVILGFVAGQSNGSRRPCWFPAKAAVAALLLLLLCSTSYIAHRQLAFDRHYLRALIAEDRSDWVNVLAEVGQALHSGVLRSHLLVVRGRAEERQGRYADAENTYLQALTYAPHAWHAHNGLGIACKRQGRLHEAIGHYHQALLLFPTSATVRNNLGAAHKALGDIGRRSGDGARAESEYGLAAEHYRSVLKAEPNNAGAHNNLGNLHKVRGRVDSAIAAYGRALRIDPGQAQAHYNLADLLRTQGRWEESIAHYREAGRLMPANPSVQWGLGSALEASLDYRGAEEAYRRAISLRHDFARAHFGLAGVLSHLGRHEDAREAYREFLRLWKEDDAFARFARERLAEMGEGAR